MKININDFQVQNDKKIDLKDWPTKVKNFYKNKDNYHNLLNSKVEQLRSFQELHYASNHYSLLLIFQGMDAAGKDGAIKHVMSGINPQGCQVFSFKHPSIGELEHDFLWRTTLCLPERGRIGIFNRSYYEEVLVVRVHPEILLSQSLPEEFIVEKKIWENRYQSIRNFEEHLYQNGTQTIKIFLHQSKEEQKKRFLKRLSDPKKNWKFTAADLKERTYWNEYMSAYEKCISATSTTQTPWYIVPADDKKNARLIISEIILNLYSQLKMSYPKVTAERRNEMKSIREKLSSE